jgi:hypothetical protein
MKRLARLMLAVLSTSTMSAGAVGQTGSVNASGYFIRSVAERTVDVLPPSPVYWRIEVFPSFSAAAARANNDRYALAARVSGRNWLFTLGGPDQRTPGGRTVAVIGPIAIPRASRYLLKINHAGGPPGSETPVHTHPGAEAIYVLKGQISQRTPMGTMNAGPAQTVNAKTPEMVMQIRSLGQSPLEQLVMFVVDADRPFSPPSKF